MRTTPRLVSFDGGRTWKSAALGADLGRYSFREWTAPFTTDARSHGIKVRASNRIGQSQPLAALWNPMGYMRNVVETIRVTAS